MISLCSHSIRASPQYTFSDSSNEHTFALELDYIKCPKKWGFILKESALILRGFRGVLFLRECLDRSVYLSTHHFYNKGAPPL